MKVRPCGDTALLLDCASLAEALAWQATIAAAGLDMVEDLVPAARTVLVRTRTSVATAAARRAIATLRRQDAPAPGRREEPIEIGVCYDGEDLAAVGDLTGLGPQGVIAAHTGQTWRVAFCGFAPGFGYLVGGDEQLRVPRRDAPRTRVPSGAVGLAGEFSGIYPRESPGGWQLIGRTNAVLWDLDRDPPALLRPGTSVRFVAAPC